MIKKQNMYTAQENVRIAIAMLKEYGVRKIVVSPGGTNIPVSQAVQEDPFFECYSIPDERSAMYFAIGLHLKTGEIIATSCTSAQATRNYVPGLTEAFYKHVPIIALTTSKLERYAYQDYMQAPDQCSLPKDCVKRSFDLPPITDENTRALCILNAKSALLEVLHGSQGPVQLNLRISDNQQGLFEDVSLPAFPKVKRYMAWDDWDDIALENKRVLVVVGEHRTFSEKQIKALEGFCERYNTCVYVNNISNYKGKYAVQGNLLVYCGGMSKLQPEIVITIGGQTGDYGLFGALCQLNNMEHWRVSEGGGMVDTYGKLTKIFECPDFFFFDKICSNKDKLDEHKYYNEWKKLNEAIDYETELPFSNLYAAQQLYKLIPGNSTVNFAIHNSLRSWNFFPLNARTQGYSTVAAFGIDGGTSMLIGESMCTDELCFMITGDLAFFYDMNALGIRHIKNNLRILLVNNDGGVEFRFLTNGWREDVHIDKYISARGHNGSAKGWADTCGFKYISARTKEEFSMLKEEFVSENDKPILFEIFVSFEDEFAARNKLSSINSQHTSKTKQILKNIVGKEKIYEIKSKLKK